MPRRGPVSKREIKPDLLYGDSLLTKFINKIMLKGKKSIAEKIVYRMMDEIQKRTGEDPLKVIHIAVENARPVLEVRPRRVGGATYQVPVEVEPRRSLTLAVRWIVEVARGKEGKAMEQRLADEIIDLFNGTGAVAKKKEDLQKMAEANRAFAHYRW